MAARLKGMSLPNHIVATSEPLNQVFFYKRHQHSLLSSFSFCEYLRYALFEVVSDVNYSNTMRTFLLRTFIATRD